MGTVGMIGWRLPAAAYPAPAGEDLAALSRPVRGQQMPAPGAERQHEHHGQPLRTCHAAQPVVSGVQPSPVDGSMPTT